MMNVKVGDYVHVQSYKHNGSLHRTWSKALVIDVKEDFVVAVTDQTWVVESDGRKWLTKEPAICFYYGNRWFNIISMVRKSGIYYYVNLASPSLYDGEAIKNIDYDLDVKVFPDDTYMILDENEYKYHQEKMNYPESITKIIDDETKSLLQMIEKKEAPFNFEYVNEYIMKYFKMTYEIEQNKKEETNC